MIFTTSKYIKMNLLQAFSEGNNLYAEEVVKLKENTVIDLTNLRAVLVLNRCVTKVVVCIVITC